MTPRGEARGGGPLIGRRLFRYHPSFPHDSMDVEPDAAVGMGTPGSSELHTAPELERDIDRQVRRQFTSSIACWGENPQRQDYAD